ncbi:cysteine hydrolase family protein [Methylocucumis oryzae]|uniref:cysteine hydrolase family protein n=1 Tax=Methylocucumis oryzae TaxID=1632867 RepID=UPI0023BAEA34|nr:isochorismatase family cysteine hydrolase [Methylocucumis oryzae]
MNNTVALINSLKLTELSVVSTPITFSKNYQELDDEPVGILKLIKELGAFQEGELGSQIIPELLAFGNRIDYLSGKHGFNAFNDTKLESYLRTKKIENILLAGAVTSICIDSTARYATEIGFKVTIISDCTSARTLFEQKILLRANFSTLR